MPVTDDDAKADAQDAKIEATADAKAAKSSGRRQDATAARADAKVAQTEDSAAPGPTPAPRPGCSRTSAWRSSHRGGRLALAGAREHTGRSGPICSSRSPS